MGWAGRVGVGSLLNHTPWQSWEGLRDQKYSPTPHSHYIDGDTEAQREAEVHLESHSNYLGQGAPHIPNTHWAFGLPGLSPHPTMSHPTCTKPLIFYPYSSV